MVEMYIGNINAYTYSEHGISDLWGDTVSDNQVKILHLGTKTPNEFQIQAQDKTISKWVKKIFFNIDEPTWKVALHSCWEGKFVQPSRDNMALY